ncbi:metal ABC transporter solute-binding protein, Zn/Mn family [Brevibacterium senegalense]|uniref:metal ABC transporter solute-binding protein, Zn/Mn family n=1 Tax=Brevibacterium senegalense TaxID=1033736 RepID=UPI0002F7D28F|nr:zinc ABC transporter substrate-binding protein [Brevibacterium senegalense]
MRRSHALAATVPLSALLLAGCGGETQAAGDGDGTTVVTSTNVYASLVEAVAADTEVEVEPIIDDAAQDPHEYEASSRDQLTLSRADMVVMNGGGYDGFVTTMLDALDTEPAVVDAVSVSDLPGAAEVAAGGHDHEGEDSEEGHAGHDHAGHDHGPGSFNEHVWYSIATMVSLVEEVEHHLAEVAPDDAAAFQENAQALTDELTGLQSRVEELAGEHEGEAAAVTEPVALWLFEDLGLTNVVPEDFVYSVEAGSDVSPLVVAEATEALETQDVQVFAYNSQTSGPEADALHEIAVDQGVPVVEMTETIQTDDDYVTWMTGIVDSVEQALS